MVRPKQTKKKANPRKRKEKRNQEIKKKINK